MKITKAEIALASVIAFGALMVWVAIPSATPKPTVVETAPAPTVVRRTVDNTSYCSECVDQIQALCNRVNVSSNKEINICFAGCNVLESGSVYTGGGRMECYDSCRDRYGDITGVTVCLSFSSANRSYVEPCNICKVLVGIK